MAYSWKKCPCLAHKKYCYMTRFLSYFKHYILTIVHSLLGRSNCGERIPIIKGEGLKTKVQKFYEVEELKEFTMCLHLQTKDAWKFIVCNIM